MANAHPLCLSLLNDKNHSANDGELIISGARVSLAVDSFSRASLERFYEPFSCHLADPISKLDSIAADPSGIKSALAQEAIDNQTQRPHAPKRT